MEYYRSTYRFGSGTAIQAYENGEPYATITINVFEDLPENYIVVNHDLYNFRGSIEYKQIEKDLFKRVVRNTECGYATTIIVELVDNWKEICKEV